VAGRQGRGTLKVIAGDSCAPFVAFVVLYALFFGPAAGAQPIPVFVSILPEKYFVERVGGEHVSVSVMVEPGQSPATYEVTPRQMARLAAARLYFRIGVPFEDAWMARIMAANPAMTVLELQEGMVLRNVDRVDDWNDLHPAAVRATDPHVWTDPRRVELMAARIRDALIQQDPADRAAYEEGFRGFKADLRELDDYIRNRLRELQGTRFMVFHPSWGYFADAYGLRQIPVETGGKEPGPRTLQRVIELGRREGVSVIFVQEQFSTRTARAIARSLDAKVVTVDPLAEDYVNNLRQVADEFAEALGGR
jgi:zinc transport system substrate-binding protein